MAQVMNIDSAHRLISAAVEEVLPEADAARLLADPTFVERHTTALLREVTAADPSGSDEGAAHSAAAEYSETIKSEVRRKK